MIERIENKGELIAIIIRNTFEKEGIEFVTPNDFSQQLAYMKHPKGHEILPHFHNEIHRTIKYTQEVLVIKEGKLRTDFYDEKCMYLRSVILTKGDIILLCSGGHGFEILEDIVMVEIKQGPYVGEGDKTRFQGVDKSSIECINKGEINEIYTCK